MAEAREARPPDPAKHRVARDLKVETLVALRRARTELASAAAAGLDKGGLGEETVKAVTQMLEDQRDVYRSVTGALPAAPPVPPPPPLPKDAPIEAPAPLPPLLATLELFRAFLAESERGLLAKYAYHMMNGTTMAAGEAVGIPNVYSASNQWGWESQAAVRTTTQSRENLAQFLAWVEEGRAAGVPALLYGYRVYEFFARWSVQWEVLEQEMEEIVDACVDAVRVTQGWLGAGGEQRELLRKESEKRGSAVLDLGVCSRPVNASSGVRPPRPWCGR